MSKSFVMDDEHWITINGNHVLINGEGEVQSGMGGALKGVKLSKPKSNMKGKLSSAKKEYEQHDKKFGARYKSEFDRHNRALERINKEQERLDKEHENDWQEKDRDTYMKKRSELRNAEAEIDRKKRDEDDKNESKLKQIGERSGYEKRAIYLKKEGVKKALSSARGKIKSAREANAYMKERGTRISKFSGQSPKIKQEREKAYREQVEAENKINALTSKLENSPEYRRANNNASVGTGQTRINGAAERARLKNEAEKELAPLREQWRKAYEKQRSLANRVGGTFKTKEKSTNEIIGRYSPQLKAAMRGVQKADNDAANTEAKYYKAFNRLNKAGKTDLGYDLLERNDIKQQALKQKRQQHVDKYNRVLGKEMNELNREVRKERAAKSALEKARPKIAERRQAIRKYNEREDEKLAKAMGLGKYRKPYYETDAFKSGKKNDYI